MVDSTAGPSNAAASRSDTSAQQQPSSSKRARVDDEDEVPLPTNQPQKRARKAAKPKIDMYGPGLACPFQKFDPKEAGCCVSSERTTKQGGFVNFKDVVQHLKLYHDESRRCKTCWEDQGDSKEDLDRHEAERKCNSVPCPQKYWLSEEEKEAYTWSERTSSDVERWSRLMSKIVWRLESAEKYTPWYKRPPPKPETWVDEHGRTRYKWKNLDDMFEACFAAQEEDFCQKCIEYEDVIENTSRMAVELDGHLFSVREDPIYQFDLDQAKDISNKIFCNLIGALPEDR